MDEAATYLADAVAVAHESGDGPVAEFVGETEALARRLRRLREEREAHHRATLELQRGEQETAANLLGTDRAAHALVEALGWSHVPRACCATC